MNQHELNGPEENGPQEIDQPEEAFVELERELRLALERVDAPAGFAERTMARAGIATPVRAAGTSRGKILTMVPRVRMWASGAIAAALVGGVFFAEQIHVREQREKAELAQRQFETAIQVTDEALQHTREQLQQAGIGMGNR